MYSRNITILINWILENLIPPFFRDSYIFMHFIIYIVYGKTTKYVMEFKDKYPNLTDNEINHYYDLIKDAPINKRETDLNSKCVKYILEHISGTKVLDASCGRGYLIKKIHNLGYYVTGSDIVINNIKKERLEIVRADINNLPFESKSFDTVICTHTLEHIRNHKKAIDELCRVTKKRLIIVIPCQREYKYTPDLHVNFIPYMYRFKEFIGIPDAEYFKLGGDFVCIINFNIN